MRKVINGKSYNTQTATAIGSATWGGTYETDRIHETLFRKRSGEYFLHGEGGANTAYRVYDKDAGQWVKGDKIVPFTYGEAKEWARKNVDADTFKKLFGRKIEDGTTKTYTYRLPVYLADKLRKEGLRRGVPASQVLAELVEKM